MNREIALNYIRRFYGEYRLWVHYNGAITYFPKYPDFHSDGSYCTDSVHYIYDTTGYLDNKYDDQI